MIRCGRISIGLAKGLGGFGIGANVAEQLKDEVGDRGEGAAPDYIALKFGEPKLDLIEP